MLKLLLVNMSDMQIAYCNNGSASYRNIKKDNDRYINVTCLVLNLKLCRINCAHFNRDTVTWHVCYIIKMESDGATSLVSCPCHFPLE